MTPRRRRWLFAAAAVVALGAVALAVALYRLDAYLDGHREALAAQVSAAVGRPVRFASLTVSLRDGLSARVTDLRIAEDPRFGDGDFLRADAASVAITPLPALLGRFHVRRISLDAPAVTIIRAADGWNVDTLGSARRSAAEPAAVGPAGPRFDGTLASLAIATATVRDGRIRFIDRRREPPTVFSIDQLDCSASDLARDAAMRFELHATVSGAAERNLTAAGTWDPRPPLSLDVRAELRPVALDLLRGAPLVGDAIPSALSSPGPLALAVHARGTQERLTLALDADAGAATVTYGTWFSKPPGTPLTLTGEAEVSPVSQRVDLQRVQLTVGEAVARAHGRIDGIAPPTVDVAVELASAPLAQLPGLSPPLADRRVVGTLAATLQATGPLTRDRLPALRGRVDLRDVGTAGPGVPVRVATGAVEIADDRAVVPETTVRVGDTPIGIACTAAPLLAPVTTCTATADRLALHALSLPAGPEDVLQGVLATATLRPGEPLSGELRSSAGVLHGIAYRDLHVAGGAAAGHAEIEALTARAFDGSVRGSGSVRVPDHAAPEFTVRATMEGLRVTSLLASQGVANADQLDGRLSADVALTGAGRDWQAVRAALRGTGRADVRDGVLRNVNLADQVLGGLTGFGGLTQLVSPRVRERHPGLFRGGDTRFDQLAASVRIADGRAVTDDARLRSRDVAVDGRGTVYLDGRLDLRATFAASPELTRDLIGGVREARALANRAGQLEVPFTISGTVGDVRVRPDSSFVADALQRALIGGALNSLVGNPGKRDMPGSQRKPTEELLRRELKQFLGR